MFNVCSANAGNILAHAEGQSLSSGGGRECFNSSKLKGFASLSSEKLDVLKG